MLQYSKHGECILQEIGAAFRGEHQADLRLVCDNRETLQAHKLVLAAASPLVKKILEETPQIECATTIHFPDVEAKYFRLLLDFLYSGQTCVPANEVEYLHDLLALLQIKPGVWRTDDKNELGQYIVGGAIDEESVEMQMSVHLAVVAMSPINLSPLLHLFHSHSHSRTREARYRH